MPFVPRKHLPLAFAVFGAVFLAFGIFFLVDDSPQQAAARAVTLLSVEAGSLRSVSVGESVLIHGRLAAKNPASFRDFLACVRDRYDGDETSGARKGEEKWTRIETIAPPLEIESARGVVAIVNSGYELLAPPHLWKDINRLGTIFESRGERAYGFFAGDEVIVEGQVTEARAVKAALLFGGNRDAYLESLRSGILVTRILGWVFTGVGGLVMLGGLGFAWRGRGAQPAKRVGYPSDEDEDTEDHDPDDHDADDDDADDDDQEERKPRVARR